MIFHFDTAINNNPSSGWVLVSLLRVRLILSKWEILIAELK